MAARIPFFSALCGLAMVIVSLQNSMAAPVMEQSDCQKSPFGGDWVSIDKGVRFLSKLQIEEVCKQITKKPVAVNNPWAGSLGIEQKYVHRSYTLRPSSRCAPKDCVWGRAQAKISENGHLKAKFSLFWSQRFLELSRENDTLKVRWRIRYVGKKKPDELGETVLVRAKKG